MNKKLLTIAVSVLIYPFFFIANSITKTAHVILNSPLLDFIDGKSYAINGKVYGLILQVRKEVREMLLGVFNANGQLIGLYLFNGKYVSISDLAKLEASIHASGDEKKITELQNLLAKIKEDFLEVTKGYVENIKPFKNQILGLLKESCRAHNKPKSFLLKWGEELDGDEGKLLREKITSFKEFEQFCIDLAGYLEDMAYSCVKAKALFIELIKQSRAEK